MENKINWETELKVSLTRAQAEKKHILLDFYNPN